MILRFKLPVLFLILGSVTTAVGGGTIRHLQYADIVGFTPLTDVRDQLRIDLDQQKIEELLAELSAESFTEAQSMYQEGSFSKTVSDLTVADGLPVEIPQGTKLTGSSGDNVTSVEVFAYAAEGYPAGATSIRVQYVNEGCYVGANPDPVTEGCLAAAGTLQNENTTLSYSYDVLTDTTNVYSIQLFTNSSEFSFEGNPLTADFQKFVDFYGSESYMDDIIQAAFAGSTTSFPTGKDLDMSNYDLEARAEVVTKASASMAVWMYVIRELEHAIYLCETGSCDENSCLGKAPVHEVDEAVAFYAGSLEGTDGSAGTGVLTYRLADKRAENFKTAGQNGGSVEGTAKVNLDLLEMFQQMSANIVAADCDAGRDDTTRIVQLMTIPLIQGTLRYAYFTGVQGDTTLKSEAEGAIFAASVLPFVAACSDDDANTIYNNLKTGQNGSADFAAVKAAFERNYECMGITGADVGGLWDADNNKYFEGAEPLGTDGGDNAGSGGDDTGSGGDDTGSGETSGSIPFSVGVAAGFSTVLFILI